MARPSTLSTLSIDDLRLALRKHERRTADLLRERAKLEQRLAAIDAELVARGGLPAAGRVNTRSAATRRRNKLPLVDALAQVLKGRTLTINDAMAAVRRAGYHTSSNNFRTMVCLKLIDKKRFRRVDRGVYTAV